MRVQINIHFFKGPGDSRPSRPLRMTLTRIELKDAGPRALDRGIGQFGIRKDFRELGHELRDLTPCSRRHVLPILPSLLS